MTHNETIAPEGQAEARRFVFSRPRAYSPRRCVCPLSRKIHWEAMMVWPQHTALRSPHCVCVGRIYTHFVVHPRAASCYYGRIYVYIPLGILYIWWWRWLTKKAIVGGGVKGALRGPLICILLSIVLYPPLRHYYIYYEPTLPGHQLAWHVYCTTYIYSLGHFHK